MRRDWVHCWLRRCVVPVALGFFCGHLLHAEVSPPTTHRAKMRIVLVGNSTVTDQAGWGKGFAECLGDNVQCINLARGGCSSKSFIVEGSWAKALEMKSEYVLIQFGHNDQPGHGHRETDPETTYRHFMAQYVDEARLAGIKPVLVTSLSRRQWENNGKIRPGLQLWADVVKSIATEKNVPLIDLHTLSIAYYEAVGRERLAEISPMKSADPSSLALEEKPKKVFDGTHLNEKGGKVFGAIVARELKRIVPALASEIR